MFEIKPKTRKEIYMAYLGGNLSLELPEPMTRDEVNLYNLCQSHSFGTGETYLLPETELTFEMNEDLGAPMAMISLAYEMEVGNTYTVSFDGVEYTCQAIQGGAGGSALGNLGAFGGDDTGEPFLIAEDGGMFVIPLNGASSAVMSIKGVVDVPVEYKYAPDPPLLDLNYIGMPAITADGVNSFEYGREDIVKLAFKKGLIKIRAHVQVRYLDGIANTSSVSDLMSDFDNIVEFVAPVLYADDSYWVQALFADCMLVIEFQPGGWLRAKAVKLAIYNNKNGNIIPQT